MEKLTEHNAKILSDLFRKIVDPIETDMLSKMDSICARMDAIEHQYAFQWHPTKAHIERSIALHETIIANLTLRREVSDRKVGVVHSKS